ncbi:MAG: UDP-2,3-diacylglucosamine diphosphatase [Gammaproteobacteria bacterium]|nr:UDP-2,3-diacylglucosamine diphosphatase [Gammaproteobacteria bacterium]
MSQHILFIADVHLPLQVDASISQVFLNFMQTKALEAQTLYILGDLFDGWIGDDVGLVAYAPFISALAKYTGSGRSLYVGLGNRDFLLKSDFAQATGAILLGDETEIELGNEKAVLLHGDTLCTDDVDYLKMRTLFTNADWQAQALQKSPTERMAIAEQLKAASEGQKSIKSAVVMDATQTGIDELLSRHANVKHIIHGHTHRPMQHAPYRGVTRWVLGDWRPETEYLYWNGQQLKLESF